VSREPSAGILLNIRDALGHQLLVTTTDGQRASAVKYDNEPVPGFVKTDTTVSTSLVLKF
jgi:hypothetical protein